jgi:hypothetical protein
VEAREKLGGSLEVTYVRYFDDRILSKPEVDGFRTSQHSNPLTGSFRRSTFAIPKSDGNTSRTVLEKLMGAGKNRSAVSHPTKGL